MNPIFPRVLVSGALLFLINLSSRVDAEEQKMQEVVVTSTALQENPLEIAQPTTVLSGDDLRRQAAGSLGETLSKELGVSSTYFGPTASRPVIRGLGGYRVQALQDGLASLDVSGLSQDHAVTLEPVVSRQIEVLKGPAALLYGSGASGGLVNVVSNRVPLNPGEPTDANGALSGAAELRGDTAAGERTGAFALDGGGLFAFHADYFDRGTNDVKVPGFVQSDALRRGLIEASETPDGLRGRIPNTGSDTRGGALGAAVNGATARGGLSWSRYDSAYGIPGEETAFIDMHQDRYDMKTQWDLQKGIFNLLQLSGSYNDYTHTEFEAPAEPGTVFRQQAYDARFIANHELGAGWRGTLGSQHMHLDFEALGDEAFVPASTTRATSVFAFEERHFDRWTIELGARAERQRIEVASLAGLPDFTDTALSVSGGTVWKLTPDRTLALNVTRTQRNPQAAELYANGPHLAARRFEIGNPDLDQETAVTADVSLRGAGETVDWTVSTYYNDYSNYIYESPTGDGVEIDDGEELPVFEYLQGGAVLYGFEAEINVPLWRTGGRELELRLASDYVRARLDNGNDLPQIPPLRFGLGLHYEAGDWHLGVEAFHSFKQDKTAANELPSGSFTLVDADVSYRFPAVRGEWFVFLKGSNLLDEDARQQASPLKDILPLPGRSLAAGVRLRF